MVLGSCQLFPQSALPLFIFEPRYRKMLAEALDGHRMFCLAMRRPELKTERPCEIAGLGLVRLAVNNPDGTSNLVLQGLTRVRIGKLVQSRPYRVHLIEPLRSESKQSLVVDALLERALDLVDAWLRMQPSLPEGVLVQLAGRVSPDEPARVETCLEALRRLEDSGTLADLVASLLLPNPLMRQAILQTLDVEERLRLLVHFLGAQITHASKSKSR